MTLRSFGPSIEAFTRAALVEKDTIIRMGYPPLRIELLTTPSGVEFDASLERLVPIDLDGRAVRIIGLEDLITNKRSAARPKELLDAIELEWLRSQRPQRSP